MVIPFPFLPTRRDMFRKAGLKFTDLAHTHPYKQTIEYADGRDMGMVRMNECDGNPQHVMGTLTLHQVLLGATIAPKSSLYAI